MLREPKILSGIVVPVNSNKDTEYLIDFKQFDMEIMTFVILFFPPYQYLSNT